MNALSEALQHPNNQPSSLVRALASQINPNADLTGLHDNNCNIKDFRPDWAEQNPSLSISMGNNGPVFNRFGGDGFEGGAVSFVMNCLNLSKGAAAKWLINRAGIIDTPHSPQNNTPNQEPKSKMSKLHSKLSKLEPLDSQEAAKRLKGWEQLKTGDTGPEIDEIARRGLMPALESGLLVAYKGVGKRRKHINNNALGFEVRGPDGQIWAIKARNAGTKAELEAAQIKTRYVYIGSGQSTPAWCTPNIEKTTSFFITEGELNGVAVSMMLGEEWGVQGVASAEALPHISPVPQGAQVYLFADADEPGDKAREQWASLLHDHGAQVYQMPADTFGAGHDACDALEQTRGATLPIIAASTWGEKLKAKIQKARRWEPKKPVEPPKKQGGYGIRHGKLCTIQNKRQPETGETYEVVTDLTEFSALITAQITVEDGTNEVKRLLEIEGALPDGRPMYPKTIIVSTAEFPAMNWPVAQWGAAAIVHAGQGIKDKARAAIQILSRENGFSERTVYKHTGWMEHPEHGPLYLSAGAVIGANGHVEGVQVELDGDRLNNYALPNPAKEEKSAVRAAIRESLGLLELAPDEVSFPVLGSAYRSVLGRSDFATWMTGETGRNKTAYMGLIMAHFGAEWSRHHLPAGWNSTANALEKTSFAVKDAIFLIDDFKPAGGGSEQNRAFATVARILQGAADGAGRATMTANRESRMGLYPRGTVMSSSETLPRGHSNRARVMLVDVPHKLIDSDAKSQAFYDAEDEAASGIYALSMAAFIQAVAGQYDAVKVKSDGHRTRIKELGRLFQFEGAHGRTALAAAELAYGWELFFSFAVSIGAITEDEGASYWQRTLSALRNVSEEQKEHLTEADPVTRALSILSGLLAQGSYYLADAETDCAPEDPEIAASCGWRVDGEGKAHPHPGSKKLGWCITQRGARWGYFLPDALHEALQVAAQRQGGGLFPDQRTLWSNMASQLRPKGLMRCEAVKKDAEGQTTHWRNTPKAKTPSGRQRLLILQLTQTLEGVYENSGASGASGAKDIESESRTCFSSAPPTLFFKGMSGASGADKAPHPPSDSPDSSSSPEQWEMDL